MDPEHLHVCRERGRGSGQLRGGQRGTAGGEGEERSVEPGRDHQLGYWVWRQVRLTVRLSDGTFHTFITPAENVLNGISYPESSSLTSSINLCLDQEPTRSVHKNIRVQELDPECDQLRNLIQQHHEVFSLIRDIVRLIVIKLKSWSSSYTSNSASFNVILKIIH